MILVDIYVPHESLTLHPHHHQQLNLVHSSEKTGLLKCIPNIPQEFHPSSEYRDISFGYSCSSMVCVEKILQDAQRTSAPNSTNVSIKIAVWMVMCREPVILTLASGLFDLYFSLMPLTLAFQVQI